MRTLLIATVVAAAASGFIATNRSNRAKRVQVMEEFCAAIEEHQISRANSYIQSDFGKLEVDGESFRIEQAPEWQQDRSSWDPLLKIVVTYTPPENEYYVETRVGYKVFPTGVVLDYREHTMKPEY